MLLRKSKNKLDFKEAPAKSGEWLEEFALLRPYVYALFCLVAVVVLVLPKSSALTKRPLTEMCWKSVLAF